MEQDETADCVRVPYTGVRRMEPVCGSAHAAGADLKIDVQTPVTVAPGERVLLPTGIRLALPPGWEGQLRPRSGFALKTGLTLLNSPGTIDADYRGEVKIIAINLGQEPVILEPGQRIAQLVICKAPQAVFQYVDTLPDTERGFGGFGSTGS